MKSRWLLFVVCVFSITVAASAADWPQWRGPDRNGISKESGLLKEWPKQGPKLLWHVNDIGNGYSTPAVAGGRIYLVSNKGLDDEFVQARRVKDGEPVWTTSIGKVGPNTPAYPFPGSRSTPTVDGAFLYALGSDGDLVCLKASDGTKVWHKNLRTDFGGQPGQWAYSESPLVDGDLVVCTPGGKDATLVALDKRKGSEIWKSAVPGGDKAAYASIIVVEIGGLKQYVQFLGDGLVGLDAKDGRFMWRYGKTGATPANIPTPVAGGSYVYSASGMAGGGLVKLKLAKDVITADPVYFHKNLPTSIGGSILLDQFLYGTNGRGLMCVEYTTGKEKWQEMGVGAGAVCYADGRIYVHGEDTGAVALVEATPLGYLEKGLFTPPDQPDHGKSKAWTYPVVANGRLYLRDMGVMWCYDIKDSGLAK
jgi:outer membrane protein assembly factor BamB